jgi:5'/3'-nucleotidase SurE
MQKPLILIANDDSIAAKGIKVLAEVMSEIGEVVVVAPDTHQSGMGHAIFLMLKLINAAEHPQIVLNSVNILY